MGDNFDQKYCQAVDKMGQNTKENYDNMIRRETIQNFFKLFTFISNEDDIKKDEKKLKDKKFTNPHTLIVTSSDDSTVKTNDRTSSLIIENKLSKYKNIVSSTSTSNIVFKGMKKSNSVLNYTYNKNKTGSLKNSFNINN